MLRIPFLPENFLILIVDDLSTNLQVVGSMIDDAGYATTFATSGKQALERVRNTKPDLILLDLMMPDMDGLQVCHKLKADREYQEIPIIFLTASHEHEHLLEAFELGAVDYITKPFNKLELLARIKTHLTLKHTTDNLKQALTELERIAQIDPLTQVLNRRSLFDAAEQEFNRACRYGSHFAILLLDLDQFKQINDTYGHLAGDRALVALAATIHGMIRTMDLIGRYGGEEFVILLPEMNARQALGMANRLRSAIAELSVPTDTKPLHMTISIGVAVYEPNDATIDSLFDRADRALHQAKAQGRNTCCVFDPVKS